MGKPIKKDVKKIVKKVTPKNVEFENAIGVVIKKKYMDICNNIIENAEDWLKKQVPVIESGINMNKVMAKFISDKYEFVLDAALREEVKKGKDETMKIFAHSYESFEYIVSEQTKQILTWRMKLDGAKQFKGRLETLAPNGDTLEFFVLFDRIFGIAFNQ